MIIGILIGIALSGGGFMVYNEGQKAGEKKIIEKIDCSIPTIDNVTMNDPKCAETPPEKN